jgi:hypothetical protein
MLDGLAIDVGTICALLDLGIQENRVIGCVYGRVAHASSGDMLAKRTVEKSTGYEIEYRQYRIRKIVIANNPKITISEAEISRDIVIVQVNVGAVIRTGSGGLADVGGSHRQW